MYQSIGVTKLFTLFALIAAVVAAGKVAFWPPTTLLGWWSPISLGMAISSGLIVGVGQSFLFPWICRQRFIRDLAPDISGDWRATLHGNWPTIAALTGDDPGTEGPTTADIRVVARLLRVKIKFRSDTKYSKSKSVSVSVQRDEDDSDVRIYYTYENTTEDPLSSDCSHHYGSAYVDVRGVGDGMSLEGLYWTNRNWTTGRNTAGRITWTRPTPPTGMVA